MTALQFTTALAIPQDPMPTAASPREALPPELHVALARLNAELSQLHRSIRHFMQAEGVDAEHLMATAQYRVLEAAIDRPGSVNDAQGRNGGLAAAEEAPPAAASTTELPEFPDLPLGTGRWRLRENGWLLVVPGHGVALALKSDERSILLHLARSPEHRIGHDELHQLADASPTLGMRPADADGTRMLSRVVRRLRRRVRNLGLTLPLRASGGGYQFIGDVGPQRRSAPLHVVPPNGHRASEAMANQAKSAQA